MKTKAVVTMLLAVLILFVGVSSTLAEECRWVMIELANQSSWNVTFSVIDHLIQGESLNGIPLLDQLELPPRWKGRTKPFLSCEWHASIEAVSPDGTKCAHIGSHGNFTKAEFTDAEFEKYAHKCGE